MPKKTFVNGEILTADDLNNFLMNQSVMVFADETARDTAIPTPVEGMVIYLESDNELFKWTGAAWNNITADSVPLSTVTTTGDLIVADGASSVTNLPVGTDSSLLYSNGTAPGWFPPGSLGQALVVGGTGIEWGSVISGSSYEIFTDSDSFVIPSGVNFVDAYIMSGGGGGGAAHARRSTTTAGTAGGGGGGGGSRVVKMVQLKVTPGSTAVITVGAGGAGGVGPTADFTANGTANGSLASAGSQSSLAIEGFAYNVVGGLSGNLGTSTAGGSGGNNSPVNSTISPTNSELLSCISFGLGGGNGGFSNPGNADSESGTANLRNLFRDAVIGESGLAGAPNTGNPGVGGEAGIGGGGGGGAGADGGGFDRNSTRGRFGGGGAGGPSRGTDLSISYVGGNGGNAAAHQGAGGGGGGAGFVFGSTGGTVTVTGGSGGNGGSGLVVLVY